MPQIRLLDTDAFKIFMVKNGFTQRTLAKSAKISDTTLNLLINNRRSVSATVAGKILDTINCKFDDIFFIVNDCKSEQKGGVA